MTAHEFVKNCYNEKENMLYKYMSTSETQVGILREKLSLDREQTAILKNLLDTVLTDTYFNILSAIDGEASLGGAEQQEYRLYAEDGSLISECGELESAAYEIFIEKSEDI